MGCHLKIRNTAFRVVEGLVIPALLLLSGCCGLSADQKTRTATYLEQIRDDPARLSAFVQEMPKGGDLHTHLSGVPYAESYLQWAAEDGMCINTATWAISASPCSGATRSLAGILTDTTLYNKAIDGLSMRDFPLAAPQFGHDHFFKAFSLFGDVSDAHKGQMLAEAASRAATDNTDYLELLLTLQSDPLARLAATDILTGDLETDYQKLLGGVRGLLNAGSTELDMMEVQARSLLSCESADPAPACRVTLRFIQQGNRVSSPRKVFASLIFGAEMALRDPRVVGVDLVAPEDNTVALANYTLHMQMLALLQTKYPSLHIALHAGELTANLVAPDHLRSHITQAVRIAGAGRIGHGVDLKSEHDWPDLLHYMKQQNIGVAILLTSNAQILGVTGSDHPFPAYLEAGVPVMLATDDQGISRGSHSAEFDRAVATYGLHWEQVKYLVRTSMDQAFISGHNLWKTPADFTRMADACATDTPAGDALSPGCDTFLRANPKAREQWRLEKRLAAFESRPWQ